MKKITYVKSSIITLGALALVLRAAVAFGQGSLTPPPGPPAPSMKTLMQIEPRTPISSLPYWITNSGSYYLTGNLAASDEYSGIIIEADHVSLDLLGFTLSGNQVGDFGIFVLSKHVSIRNGFLRDWLGGIGSDSSSDHVQVEHVQAAGSHGNGIELGSHGYLADCVARDNYYGITVGAGSTVKDCISSGNWNGIVARDNCTIKGCTASGNRNNGIITEDGGTIIDCVASDNVDGGGIFCNNAAMVTRCTGNNNHGGSGVGCGDACTVRDSTFVQNRWDGIAVSSRCRVDSNVVISNQANGIGVYGKASLVVRNHAAQNSPNYNIPSGNKYGQIVWTDGEITAATGWENFGEDIIIIW